MRHASCFVDGGLRPALPSKNTVSASCFVGGMLYTQGILSMAVSDFSPHSKSTMAPSRSKKSVPSRPAAVVGSGHTKECDNSLLFSRRVTDRCPLISRTFPVTPYVARW